MTSRTWRSLVFSLGHSAFDPRLAAERRGILVGLFAHLPKDALAKNFGTNPAAFDHIPKQERFIFEAPVPLALSADMVGSGQGRVPLNMKFKLMA